jgi:hypothetical protein
MYKSAKFRWIPQADSGMDPEKFSGILVTDRAGLYRVQDGNAALGIVEPTGEGDVYRIVGADFTLLNTGSLSKLAQRLTEMSGLQLLLSIIPHVLCPDEILM